MMTLPIIEQIDRTIETQIDHMNQRTAGRLATVDTIAMAASPPSAECTFDLETTALQSAIIDIAADTSGELLRLGDDLRKDEEESRVFLAEHRLNRRPPFGTIPTLGAWITGAMIVESLGTAPAYAPYVGAPLGYATSALISLGVAVPAAIVGMGIVAMQHQHRLGYRLTGFGSVIIGVGMMGFALLCGAHFRDIVAKTPRLIMQPWKAKDEIVASISTNWAAPLFDPSNWGLLAAGLLAGGIVAWKVFNTFGYVGWRAIALREKDCRDAIIEAGDDARAKAAAAKKLETRHIKMKVVSFASNRRKLTQATALNEAAITSHRTGLKIVAKMRADAMATGRSAWRLAAAAQSVTDWQVDACPADKSSAPNRSAFAASVGEALARQNEAIAKEPDAHANLSVIYRSFVTSLQRAVESALGGQRLECSDDPTLSGPSGGRQS